MCPVLGHELDKKRGNVFYDVKISYLRSDLNGTLFEGQVDTQMIKGKKLFVVFKHFCNTMFEKFTIYFVLQMVSLSCCTNAV